MKNIISLQEYFLMLLTEADSAYWLTRKPIVKEIIEMWVKVTGSNFSTIDEKYISVRSGYDYNLVVERVSKDKTFWVRLLMAFFTYGKRLNNTERKFFLREADKAWEIYSKTQAEMLRYDTRNKVHKIFCK